MQEIGLQELLEQVKRELLAPSKDPDPIFFIDKVELELAVKVVKDAGAGVKITVLGFVEGNLDGSLGGERGHIVRISLSPLLEREAILKEVMKDPASEARIKHYIKRALTKGDGMAGNI